MMKMRTIAALAVALLCANQALAQSQLPAHTTWGNPTGSQALPKAMTQAEVAAMCNVFTTSLIGCVPASGGGTANFLRADGTFAVPSGGVAGSIAVGTTTVTGGTTLRVLYDNGGVLGEYTNTQLTALCNVFTSTLKGCAPLSGGGTTNFLRADGTWAAPSSSFSGNANPTALIGLSAVNGVAATSMASDSAPALDQGITPTWTSPHTWNIARSFASATAATLRDIHIQAATTTIVGNTGTPITSLNKVYIGQPTLTDSSAVTVTDAASLYIDNAPAAAGSVTITNPWALRVGAGNVKFPGTGNVVGTITSGTWNGTAVDLTHGGTNNNAITADNGGIVYSDASKLLLLASTASANQCLLSGSHAAPSWGACAGGAAVSSVSNSDSTLTISPTTGAVVASLNLAHANTWTAVQNLTVNSNAGVANVLSNNSAGAAAYIAQQYNASSASVLIGAAGAGYTGIPILQNRSFMDSGGTLVLNVEGAAPIVFGISSAEVGRISSATPGELDLGLSATTAGALKLYGGTSGSTILKATAAAGSTTATLQAASGTLALLDVADQTISGGANVTSQSLSTGNITIDCGSRPLQFITNGGAFTITAPAADGSCFLLITNNGSAGVVGTSGFTGTSFGDAFDTVNGHKFAVSIFRINSVASYVVKSLN